MLSNPLSLFLSITLSLSISHCVSLSHLSLSIIIISPSYEATKIVTDLPQPTYSTIMDVMGYCHLFLSSIVFISYFVCNHPSLPSLKNGIAALK